MKNVEYSVEKRLDRASKMASSLIDELRLLACDFNLSTCNAARVSECVSALHVIALKIDSIRLIVKYQVPENIEKGGQGDD